VVEDDSLVVCCDVAAPCCQHGRELAVKNVIIRHEALGTVEVGGRGGQQRRQHGGDMAHNFERFKGPHVSDCARMVNWARKGVSMMGVASLAA
jgi:hypothetical protein